MRDRNCSTCSHWDNYSESGQMGLCDIEHAATDREYLCPEYEERPIQGIEAQLDRIEEKLDRLLEGKEGCKY